MWVQDGHQSAQLEELVHSLEKWREVTAVQHPKKDAKLHGVYLSLYSVYITKYIPTYNQIDFFYLLLQKCVVAYSNKHVFKNEKKH